MTVIAYKNGVIACDTGAFSIEGVKVGTCEKIFRSADDTFFAAGSGDAVYLDNFFDWLRDCQRRIGTRAESVNKSLFDYIDWDDAPLPNDRQTDIVVIHKDGRVRAFDPEGYDTVIATTYAMGVNWQFTLGLLTAGHTPAEAVGYMCTHGQPATFPIEVYEFGVPGHMIIRLVPAVEVETVVPELP